jgi:hypothetical protein
MLCSGFQAASTLLTLAGLRARKELARLRGKLVAVRDTRRSSLYPSH